MLYGYTTHKINKGHNADIPTNSKDYLYMHSMHTPPFGRKEYMTDNIKLQMDIKGQNKTKGKAPPTQKSQTRLHKRFFSYSVFFFSDINHNSYPALPVFF